jgi:hypothetical protein
VKILLGYSYYNNNFDVKKWIEAWISRLQDAKINIESFCLTINPPGPRLSWRELDKKWKRGDNELYDLYKSLLLKSRHFDVFINWNGINLHPEFLEMLPITKVYSCFDDPESSEDLSKPVAKAYDLCLVGNISEVETYRNWGVKNVVFWPLGFFEGDYDSSITEEQILGSERDLDITLLCERESRWRKERLDKFSNAFPNGNYYGRGWKNGYLDEKKKIPLYRKTKIGPNFHNSTGPLNYRTYMLPANGVMLLCDNKSYLAKLYTLGEEAIGFDTVEEAIELTKYYLEHDDERKRIAIAGWKRAKKNYNEISVFKIGLNNIKNISMKNENNYKNCKALHLLKREQLIGKVKYYLFVYWSLVIRMVFVRLFCKLKSLCS